MASQGANYFNYLLLANYVDMLNDTFKIILMQSGFTFNPTSHDVYADVSASELATAYGYTAGGATLAGVAASEDAITPSYDVSWNNPSWLAAGGNLVASGAIIYDDTIAAPVSDPLVCYIDFSGNMTTYNGGTFTIANIKYRLKCA